MFSIVAGIGQQSRADELRCRLVDQRRKRGRVLAGTLAGFAVDSGRVHP